VSRFNSWYGTFVLICYQPQIFIMLVGTAEKVFKVGGQRSRSYMYRCVNAIMEEVYI